MRLSKTADDLRSLVEARQNAEIPRLTALSSTAPGGRPWKKGGGPDRDFGRKFTGIRSYGHALLGVSILPMGAAAQDSELMG